MPAFSACPTSHSTHSRQLARQDNTLTEPYAELVAPQLASALEVCKRTWPDRVVLFSNSAGLQEFDPEGAAVPAHEAILCVCVGKPLPWARAQVLRVSTPSTVANLS